MEWFAFNSETAGIKITKSEVVVLIWKRVGSDSFKWRRLSILVSHSLVGLMMSCQVNQDVICNDEDSRFVSCNEESAGFYSKTVTVDHIFYIATLTCDHNMQ